MSQNVGSSSGEMLEKKYFITVINSYFFYKHFNLKKLINHSSHNTTSYTRFRETNFFQCRMTTPAAT